MGIAEDLMSLKVANTRFSDLYNERAVERAGSTAELTKKLRAESENLYGLIKLHIEYVSNTDSLSEKGEACIAILGVINEIVRDARQHLNQRMGRVDASANTSPEGGDDVVSPIPFPGK